MLALARLRNYNIKQLITTLREDKDAAKIRAMYTHPDWARKGVGTLILEIAEKERRTSGPLFPNASKGDSFISKAFTKRYGEKCKQNN